MKGKKAVFSGDIGCYTLGNAKPLDMVDTCLCMGAGVTIAQGLHRVEPDAVNFAFIGQFAETPRDTIFTTEYSIRTGMEAVYTLMNVDRGVPEVWGSKYDVRELLRACYYAVDKKSVDDLPTSFKEEILLKVLLKHLKGTDLEVLLKESGLVK